jgi:hypothetical protein
MNSIPRRDAMRINRMLAGAVVAIAMVPAATALADGKADSKVTATFHPSAGQPAPHFYSGKVKSPKPACEKNRDIRLKKPNGGVIAEGNTGNDNTYSLSEPTPSGAGERTIYALPNEKCKSAKVTIFGGG